VSDGDIRYYMEYIPPECWRGTPKDSQHLRPWVESTTPRRDEIEPGESVA
jgi:hypothetical protein